MNKHNQFKKILTYLGIDMTALPASVLTLPINQLQTDSRLIKKNDLFIALKGHHVDGNTYIEQAIAKGAVAVLSDSDDPEKNKRVQYIQASKQKTVPVISLFQLSHYLSSLANDFYQNPSEALTLVGVTGTNGKTTVTQLLSQWVRLLGYKTGVMGTLGNGVYGHLIASENTTLNPVALQSQLAAFVQEKVDFVAMEVSSHGLVEKRVADLAFDAVIFTNLSRDHLDFHGSMSEYQLAKRSLFDENQLAVSRRGIAIINFDDNVGREWLLTFGQTVAFSIDSQNLPQLRKFEHYVGVENIVYHPGGATLVLQSSWGNVTFTSPLIGAFNVSNMVAALATLLALDYPFELLVKAIPKLRSIPGRMERFLVETKPEVIIDYAHTPDALVKALQAARQHCQGKLWVIFGCGGDRDRGKRPMMAKAAEQLADHVMLTHDNPRTEDESQIINDILQGFTTKPSLLIEPNREEAIRKVIAQADINDTILIAGKGHEAYQIIGKVKYPYSDRETVATLLGVCL